jgi:hypothetical protein
MLTLVILKQENVFCIVLLASLLMLITIGNVIGNALEILTLLLKIQQDNVKALALLDTLIQRLNNVLLFVLLDFMDIIKGVILTVLMFLQQYLLTM